MSGQGGLGQRTLVVACPQWPLTASRPEPAGTAAVAVVEDERVVAVSEAARAGGARSGLRRREAQARCPELEVRRRDRAGEVRAFEPVLEALEAFGAPVATRDAGWAAFATRGPARYFGGEQALVEAVGAALDALGIPGRWRRVGVGDGAFVATQAARHGLVVARGEGAAFLAPLGIELVERPALADVLRRLGVDTLGGFAALGEAEVLARFGTDGALAHRLARGLGDGALRPRTPRADLSVALELDPPAEGVEAVAFVARGLASELDARLDAAGLACTRLRVEVATTGGERLVRRWSGDGGVDPAVVAERLRWQLEAWSDARVQGADRERAHRRGTPGRDVGEVAPWSGVERVALVPEEVAPALGRQLDLWSRPRTGEERVGRAVARVQGMLGHSAVVRAVLAGGRGPGERVRLVTFGEPDPGAAGPRPPGSGGGPGARRRAAPVVRAAPWPGRLPPPSPAVVPLASPLVELLDAGGAHVAVDARGEASAVPVGLVLDGDGVRPVTGWAGPWPADERWWDGPSRRRRRARVQVVTAEGGAYLLALEHGRWVLEGAYD
ncbi:MAG TPA: DNA polymerase Y family protein [Acidimicrobiales bacterium]|nr:DNA polymerase Y family protein [Acidimicrobiales bacterium]